MTAHKILSRLRSLLIRSIGDSIAVLGKEKRVCIISYHRILEKTDPLLETEPDVETFRWQMETLAACFNVLPLYEAVVAIREDRVPPRAVCITFDDGYRSTYDFALPILKRLGLPATVFITTGFLDEGAMWNDRIVEAVRRLPDSTVELQALGMGAQVLRGLKSRQQIVNRVNEECKYLHPEGRLDVVEKLERLVGKVPTYNLMLTREMVASLAKEGIEIGGHTDTHPILTKLSDDVARHEIIENKKALESIIGRPLRLFAYPNGIVGMDYDQRHVQMVEAVGFFAAFTTAIGAACKGSDIFQLPRRRPWDGSPFMFSIRLLRWLASDGKFNARIDKSKTPVDEISCKKSASLVSLRSPPQAESSGVQPTLSSRKKRHEE